jgi:hypothetical protein
MMLRMQVGVLRDLDAQRVFHRAHAGQRMGAGADAADALVKAQASRGSRPFRMTSSPRHMVPVLTALRMTLLSVEVDLAAHVALRCA